MAITVSWKLKVTFSVRNPRLSILLSHTKRSSKCSHVKSWNLTFLEIVSNIQIL